MSLWVSLLTAAGDGPDETTGRGSALLPGLWQPEGYGGSGSSSWRWPQDPRCQHSFVPCSETGVHCSLDLSCFLQLVLKKLCLLPATCSGAVSSVPSMSPAHCTEIRPQRQAGKHRPGCDISSWFVPWCVHSPPEPGIGKDTADISQIFPQQCNSGPSWACPARPGSVGQHPKIHCPLHIVPLVTQILSWLRHFHINTRGNDAQGIADMRNTKSTMKTSLFLLFLCLDSKPLSALSSHVPNQADNLLVSLLQTPNSPLFPWDTLHHHGSNSQPELTGLLSVCSQPFKEKKSGQNV